MAEAIRTLLSVTPRLRPPCPKPAAASPGSVHLFLRRSPAVLRLVGKDLANLSKALWTAYERPINWQTVSITSPAAEFDAPILFISGSEKWEYTAAEAMKLREYVERGGTASLQPRRRNDRTVHQGGQQAM